MFKLASSAAKRLITAISSPFRMLIVRILRLFNVNVISAKLIQPLTKNVKNLLKLRPSDRSEYVRIGRTMIYKKLIGALVLAACAGVFIYFNVYAGKVAAAPTTLTGIKTDISYAYNDISIKEFSGVANIISHDGVAVYTGDIDRGVCRGNGVLYNREGARLYEGAFDNNKYNGYGVRYRPGGGVEYEGQFLDNLYHGSGKQYGPEGGLLYSGSFEGGLYKGEGKLYGENGALRYEGGFAEGKRHGAGVEYYASGTVWYKGDFYQDSFQGQGTLYTETGQPIYTGSMKNGQIHYHALLGATLAEIDAAFLETPVIYYQEGGSCCFFYEKAGVSVTADCRVRVHEWQREKENPSDGYYYMPGADNSPPSMGDDAAGPASSDLFDAPPKPETDPAGQGLQHRKAFAGTASLSGILRPVNWVTYDPYTPEKDDDDDESSSSSSSSSSGEAPPASSAPPSSEPERSGGAGYEEAPDRFQDELRRESQQSDTPQFIERSKALYFEVDKDVWQSEAELDRSKVLVKRVTVLGAGAPPEKAAAIEDNAPPAIEDCVMIDSLRKRIPTAFDGILFEMDKQNKLFQRVWNINNAGRIPRSAYTDGSVTYLFCYLPEEPSEPAYYSIES